MKNVNTIELQSLKINNLRQGQKKKTITVCVLTSSYRETEQDKAHFIQHFLRSLEQDIRVIILIHEEFFEKPAPLRAGDEVIRFPFVRKSIFDKYFKSGILTGLRNNSLAVLFLPWFFIKQIYYLLKVINKYNINTVHAQWLLPQGLSAVIVKKIFKPNLKVIVTSYGSDVFSYNNNLLKWVKRKIITNTNQYCVISKSLKNYLSTPLKIVPEKNKIQVIPVGIDDQKFYYAPILKKK